MNLKFFPYFYGVFLAGGLVVHKLTKSKLCFILFYLILFFKYIFDCVHINVILLLSYI